MKCYLRYLCEGIFVRGLGWKVVSCGFLIGVVIFVVFMIVYDNDSDCL